MGYAVLANTAFASGSSSVTYPQSQDMIQQNQNLAQAQQAIDQNQIDTDKLREQLQQKLQQPDASNTTQATQQPPTPTTTTPTAQITAQKVTPTPSTSTAKTCDCYTTTDPYNYSGNFLYDNAGKRISRVYPSSCQCNPQTQNTAPTITSSGTANLQTEQNTQISTSPVVMPNSSSSQTSNQQSSSGGGWNIKY